MPLIIQNGKIITKSGRLSTDLGCCCSTCQCVRCRNGCSFYVSGEGYDTYDARCGAPSAPTGGYMSWLPPTAQSSPGVSSGFEGTSGNIFVSDYIHAGKASQSVRAPFMPQTSDVVLPYVWGHRYKFQGTGSTTDYQWYAGFSIACTSNAFTSVHSLAINAYLWDLFATGENQSTTRRSSVVLQTATATENDCNDVSVNSESRYNECSERDFSGQLFSWCRIEIPFPLSIQINGDGTTLNGTLYAWSTPVLSSTPASVSFVVSKQDCCFQCDSGSTNVCCNPLP
jgi:hypothetical protein